jgi:hypothetical protein
MSASLEDQIAGLSRQVRRIRDAEEVRRLMHLYHQACDGWDGGGTHKDPLAIATLFVPDGVWDIPIERDGVWNAPSAGGLKGHAAIAAEAEHLQITPWVIHYVVNPIVDIDGDSANGRFKAFVRVADPNRSFAWVCGIYHVDAVRTTEGWKFARLEWQHIDTWV